MIGSLPHSSQLPSLPASGKGTIPLENLSPESLNHSLLDHSQTQNPQADFMKLLQGLQLPAAPQLANGETFEKSVENEFAQVKNLASADKGLPLKATEIAVVPGQGEFDLSKLINLSKFQNSQAKVILGQNKASGNVSHLDPNSIQFKELTNMPFDQVKIDQIPMEGRPKELKPSMEMPDFKNIQMNKAQAPQKMAIDQYQFQSPDSPLIKLHKLKSENTGLENAKQNAPMPALTEIIDKKVNPTLESNANDNDFLNMANKESKAPLAIKVADQATSEQFTTKTIDEMSKQFELPIRKGEKEFSIQVRDQQIGDMKIKATQGRDGIHLRVESNSVEVQDFLNSHKSRIIENLANSGIRVSEVKIEQGSMTSQDKDFSQSQHEQAKHGHGRDRQDEGKERRRELWEIFQQQSRAA